MKQEPAFFEGKSPVLVYIAKRLKDALRLEQSSPKPASTSASKPTNIAPASIFRTVRAGAFFYVLPDSVDRAFAVMERARLHAVRRIGLTNARVRTANVPARTLAPIVLSCLDARTRGSIGWRERSSYSDSGCSSPAFPRMS